MNIPTVTDIAKMTPMMRQYYEIKKDCPGAILFFRMGDFYEIFADDAEEVAPILDIVLTSRERGDNQKVKFCGVPHHSATGYWQKLLRRGFKVAIADQLEDAAEAKGLVKRGIIKMLTPGVNTEFESLEANKPNYLAAIHQSSSHGPWALAIVELSTGEFRLGSVATWDDLIRHLKTFRPREILLRRFLEDTLKHKMALFLAQENTVVDHLPESILQDEVGQKEIFQSVFGTGGLSTQKCGAIDGGLPLVAAVLERLKNLKASLESFLSVKPLFDPEAICLSDTVIRDLEIFETSRSRSSKGSLFHQVNYTQSPMGARHLRWALSHPLVDEGKLNLRHNTVDEFFKLGEQRLGELRSFMKGFPDLERLSSRMATGSISPVDLGRCRAGLRQIKNLRDKLCGELASETVSEYFNAFLTSIDLTRPLLDTLEMAIEDEPQNLGLGVGVFKVGFDEELDRYQKLAQSGSEEISLYENSLRAETGISSLKIKHHGSFGLLIEVTKSNLNKVPDYFIRRQTMVNNERFITDELKTLEETLFSASDLAKSRERVLFDSLLEEIKRHHSQLLGLSHAVGDLDLAMGFAWLALKDRYCKATINLHETIELKACRHPVVEAFVGSHQFIANHVELGQQSKIVLITGPNMAGKSTIMRQTALCAILNQAGSFIPAERASLPIFDQIYTRVGASDDLSQGQSTFMVEMTEAAQILRHATTKSLVILDEVGRGTSSDDGLAIASGILKYLSRNIKPWTLFATHYHELVPLSSDFDNVSCFQTEVVQDETSIRFTHRLVEGASGSSFGIEVARLAGIPQGVLQEAKQFLALLERQGDISLNEKATIQQPKPSNQGHPIDRQNEVIARIERTNPNRLTPLQALNLLVELKDILEKDPPVDIFSNFLSFKPSISTGEDEAGLKGS